MLRESGHEHMTGSLVAPIFDANASPVQAYGRKIGDLRGSRVALHLYLPGPLAGIFNREAVIASEEIILCEAIIDAMSFWAAGYGHVTASFGKRGHTPISKVDALCEHADAAHKGAREPRHSPPQRFRAAPSARPEKCFQGNFSEIEGL